MEKLMLVVRHITEDDVDKSKEKCAPGIASGREDRGKMKEKGKYSKRDRRLSNRIFKAQLMYTISRGRIIEQKARDGARGDDFLRLRSTT